MILAAFVGERAALWIAKHKGTILAIVAALAIAVWIGTLKHRIDELKGEVKKRDDAMKAHLALDAKAAAAVADERTRILQELTAASLAAADAQREAAAATKAASDARRGRMAAVIAADPKADRPVGPVLGSIFKEERR